MQEQQKCVLIIHNVRSAHNVGSLFRTADGAGIDYIFLTGYTPKPSKKSSVFTTKAEKELTKTALGAEESVPWKKSSSLSAVLATLREEGYEIVALEQSSKSVNYKAYIPKEKVALIVGNEVLGVDIKILKQCDVILEIPMWGKKNSLNVSVAGGIALYHISSILRG
ncbi:MAG: RNA methyltransferase [Candidatus Moranbacteria bacterium]|nr:RNA methyltransferase [Candidatus Moranbacteria bacterium]MDD3964717.1 RNA methyltransferase [Candidatus Moranbacteria bacterium]